MENQDRRVLCLENSELAAYLLSKRQELADKPKGITENVDATLSKAYSNICNSKTHIQTLKDLFWSDDNWFDRIIGNIIYSSVPVGEILVIDTLLHIHFVRFTHVKIALKTRQKTKG